MNRNTDAERPLLDDELEGDVHPTYNASSAPNGSSPSLYWFSARPDEGPSQEHPLPRPPRPSTFIKRPTQKAAQRARKTAWICIDSSAKRSFLHADKRAVIHGLGLNIPLRDMRLLDYNLLASESGKILVRDNAIIVAMEHIRLIITADKAIVPREATEQSPLSDRFVDVLEDAVSEWARQIAHEQAILDGTFAAASQSASQSLQPSPATKAVTHFTDTDDDNTSASMRHEYQPLPFELVVLEAALKEIVAASTAAVTELEGVAHPALDALTKSVTSGNLERVRKVKTRHQRLFTRCEALREELQRFLGDDDDMTRMCLTRRVEVEEAAKYAAAQQEQQAADQQILENQPARPVWTQQLQRSSMSHHVGSYNRRTSGSFMRAAAAGASTGRPGSPPHLPPASYSAREGGYFPHANSPLLPVEDEELDAEAQQDVENLLESYFMQVDGLYDKLISIEEYIKDTEEYINIELDSSRNRLIRLEIILTAATFALAPFNLLAGILGENLVIPEGLTKSVKGFYGLNAIAFACCFLFFYSIMMYMKYRKLL